ncbi:MAG TPA: pyridoxal-phosphate dependent enzyme [Bryobacteraceae bacterium]|nr:pyridoxal-phosphate dependent enzyme [Bryobacteraceae bacterium]
MPEAWLECPRCRARFPFEPLFRGCSDCRKNEQISPLEMQYDFGSGLPQNRDGDGGIWRWRDLLPPVSPEHRVTLGEGGTPLLPLSGMPAGPSVLLKNETQSPTWSWKDRPNCVSVAVARHFAFRHVAAISTGNHGCALSAYASAAGLKATVLCHEQAAESQLRLMQVFGASTVRGGDQEGRLEELVARGDTFPSSILCPRAGYSNPFGIEGFKTIAFEIVEQLGRAPDRVFVPVGSGDGIYGIWKGFRELHQLGAVNRPPRMVGCQATGADSAWRAFQAGAPHIRPLQEAKTVALSVAELAAGDHALRAVYESQGMVLTATDKQIGDAVRELARQGFALEPASALTLACVGDARPATAAEEIWVLIGSGSLAKWPDTLRLLEQAEV